MTPVNEKRRDYRLSFMPFCFNGCTHGLLLNGHASGHGVTLEEVQVQEGGFLNEQATNVTDRQGGVFPKCFNIGD